MAAMLPVHDVNLACQELYRCVKEHGAVGAFVRPNYVNGRYWHSTYWDPLYSLLQDLNVPLCFHEWAGPSPAEALRGQPSGPDRRAAWESPADAIAAGSESAAL